MSPEKIRKQGRDKLEEEEREAKASDCQLQLTTMLIRSCCCEVVGATNGLLHPHLVYWWAFAHHYPMLTIYIYQ